MASQRLINSTAELKQAMGAVRTDLKFEAIQSFVDDAEINHIIPAIGQAQYDALRETGLDATQARALALLRKSVSNFTIHYYAAFGAVSIDETGITVLKDDRRLPASDKKVFQLRTQSRLDGFKALEATVNFLEANRSAFSPYISSQAHTDNRALFTNTTADFERGINLRGNSEVFYSLRSTMRMVEENYLEPVLGETVTNALRAAILINTLSTDQQQLLQKIWATVPYLTIGEAIPMRLVEMDGSGLISASNKSNSDNIEELSPGETRKLQAMMNSMLQNGQTQLAKLKKWLNANADKFSGYTAADIEALAKLNDEDRSFYFM